MQFRLTLAFATLAAASTIGGALANPVQAPRRGFSLDTGSADGAYVFDRNGTVTSFIPHAAIKSREAAVIDGDGEGADVTKRGDGSNCFKAKFSGSDKWNAVLSLSYIIDDYNVITAGGAIATQYGNAIAYACNFDTQMSLLADSDDIISYDTTINKACGSSTAGRYRFANDLEYGRTASGKPWCDGS